MNQPRLPRTQFDDNLLFTSSAGADAVYRNHGRHLLSIPGSSTYTALATGGAEPSLRVFRDRDEIAAHPLPGMPAAPSLIDAEGEPMVWVSVTDVVLMSAHPEVPPIPVNGLVGELLDVALMPDGELVLALLAEGTLSLVRWRGKILATAIIDDVAGRATLDVGDDGALHLVYEKAHGIEYRRLSPHLQIEQAERPALPFGYHPVVLAHRGQVIIAYQGESWPLSEEDTALWEQYGRNRRIGLGGYIAALVYDGSAWQRHTLADSRQFSKPLWPHSERFRYDYPAVNIRPRVDLYSAPTLTLGPDGVPQMLWANVARRWIYSSRFLADPTHDDGRQLATGTGHGATRAADAAAAMMASPQFAAVVKDARKLWITVGGGGDLAIGEVEAIVRTILEATDVEDADIFWDVEEIAALADSLQVTLRSSRPGVEKHMSGFTPAVEVRGPIEELVGPCLAPRRASGAGETAVLPAGMVSLTRLYRDELRLPGAVVAGGRRVDFVQLDELVAARGVELRINPMERHSANPIMRAGPPGDYDASGVAAAIVRHNGAWHADIVSKRNNGGWRKEYPATSDDGINWRRGGPIAAGDTCTVDGVEFEEADCRINFIEDNDEPNSAHRYKGFWLKPNTPWGAFLAVTSPDAKTWKEVPDFEPVMSDEDIVPRIDPYDIPERRFKATGNARSFCGRVCAQWTSPDGMHWHDRRDCLGFDNVFTTPHYWNVDYPQPAGGRILVEPWAGPDDEEEVHGGYVFRDGEQWLVLYMKWTSDGHIIPALASSRDGLNFSRIAGGAPTLPLGQPGTWESGRLATRNPPYLVDGVWWQHYTGSGWKHGQGGVGKRPHAGSPLAAAASPMQTGLATMRAGRWSYLGLKAEEASGEIRTIAYRLEGPHHLTVAVEGFGQPGVSVACCVIDSTTGRAVTGFAFEDCDSVTDEKPVTWRGRSLAASGIAQCHIGVRFNGPGVRLFGLKFTALTA